MAASALNREDDRLDALVARPLPAPEGIEGSRRRRWELFAPTLVACIREALAYGTRSLFEEAERTEDDDRRRLASTAATELATRTSTIEARCTSALLRLFLDADGLAEYWQASTGAFALSQSAERLLASRTHALEALGRRLHGTKRGAPATDARAMAGQLTGLLAAALDTEDLPSHARNVVAAAWSRRLEDVLPGLAGLQATERTDGVPVLARRRIGPADEREQLRIPTALLDALTRAQLQALEDEAPADLSGQVRARLAAALTLQDPEAAHRGLLEIDAEVRCLTALCGAIDTSPLAATHLRRLAPVLARIHVEHRAVHPAIAAWLETLVEATLDLSDAGRDPRLQAIEDLVGDALARFTGAHTDVEEFLKEAYDRLEPNLRSQRERRERARDASLEERHLAQAESRADAICERLAVRTALAPFVASTWREALVQAQVRHGIDSPPWRRLLVLGQALLTHRTSDLRSDRAAFADALSLALPDAFAVEAELDALYDALELATDAPVAAAPLPIEDAATELPNLPVEAGPWRLEDGRRCWVLHDDGDVLLSDALGRDLHWRTRESFDAALDAGEIRRLSSAPPLGLYARR